MTEGVVEATPGVGAPPSSEVSAAPPQRGRARVLPSVADCVFMLWVLILPVLFADKVLNGDGDLFRHLRAGATVLNHGLFFQDPFSFTRPGAPYIPIEWLSEVVFSLAYRLGGWAGVAILTGLIVATANALVVRFLRDRAVDPLLSLLVGVSVGVLGSVHWLARPHLFTFVGTILLLGLLEGRRRGRVWPYLPLFALWANLHGGFIYGFMLIAIYLGGDLLEWWSARPNGEVWLKAARDHGSGLLLAIAGSLLTPSGGTLLGHALAQIGPSSAYLMDNTQEFLSPNFHELSGRLFLVVLLAVFALLALNRRPSYPRLLLVLGNAAFCLVARRNIPLFGLTVLPVMALHLDARWRGLGSHVVRHVRGVLEHGEAAASRVPWWSATVAIVLVAVGLNGGQLRGRSIVAGRVDLRLFPVAAVERAREARLEGRLFSYFTWGGYVLHAWPQQKVFIDGMTAFYGSAIMQEYSQIDELQPGWRAGLDRWGIATVMFPTRSALVSELSRDPGWRTWYRDSTATILLRRAGSSPPAGP